MLRYFHAAVSPLSGRDYPTDQNSAVASDEPSIKLTRDNFSQLVLYVGQEPLDMPAEIVIDQRLAFSYQVLDVRDLDAETLLASNNPGAILFGFMAKKSCANTELKAIIERLKSVSSHTDLRNELLADLFFISRLRGLQLSVTTIIGEEAMSVIIPKEFQEIDYLFIQGEAKGEAKALIATGLKMYRRGDSLEEIRSFLELSPELYQQLLDSIRADGKNGQ
jgi:hypothetical protein